MFIYFYHVVAFPSVIFSHTWLHYIRRSRGVGEIYGSGLAVPSSGWRKVLYLSPDNSKYRGKEIGDEMDEGRRAAVELVEPLIFLISHSSFGIFLTLVAGT